MSVGITAFQTKCRGEMEFPLASKLEIWKIGRKKHDDDGHDNRHGMIMIFIFMTMIIMVVIAVKITTITIMIMIMICTE